MFVCLSYNSYAQAKQFESATLLYLDGTSNDVFIELPNLYDQVSTLQFKRTLDSEIETLPNNKVKGIKMLQRGINLELVAYKSGNKNHVDEALESFKYAEVIVDGYIKLFKVYLRITEYDDNAVGSKGYLFIMQKDDESVQLDLFNTRKVTGGRIVTDRYKGVLNYYFRDCPKLGKEIRTSTFTALSLVGLIKSYDDCFVVNSDENIIIVDSEKISKQAKERGGIKAIQNLPNKAVIVKPIEVNENYTSKSLEHSLSAGIIFPINKFIKNSLGAKVGYSLSFYNQSLTQNMGATFELGFVLVNHEWNDSFSSAGGHNVSVLTSSLLLDWFPNRVTKKIKINAGFALMIPNSSSEYKDVYTNYFTFPLGFEYLLVKKTKLRFRYNITDAADPPGELIEVGFSTRI